MAPHPNIAERLNHPVPHMPDDEKFVAEHCLKFPDYKADEGYDGILAQFSMANLVDNMIPFLGRDSLVSERHEPHGSPMQRVHGLAWSSARSMLVNKPFGPLDFLGDDHKDSIVKGNTTLEEAIASYHVYVPGKVEALIYTQSLTLPPSRPGKKRTTYFVGWLHGHEVRNAGRLNVSEGKWRVPIKDTHLPSELFDYLKIWYPEI